MGSAGTGTVVEFGEVNVAVKSLRKAPCALTEAVRRLLVPGSCLTPTCSEIGHIDHIDDI